MGYIVDDRYVSNELDSWLNQEYLLEIADDLVELEDYVPKTIEYHLPNYDDRFRFVQSKPEWYQSDEFVEKELLDQMAGGASWEEHITVYDEFFERHPEFSQLIRDKSAYEKWRLEEVDY